MVHRREIDGRPVVFGNQGDLYMNAMTWFDHDTGSIWSQPFGEAIAGPLKGQKLELLPSTMTRWAAWREAHPGTLALDAPDPTSGFDLQRLVIVVEFGDDRVGFRVADLNGVGVANDEVLGIPVAVVLDPTNPEVWSVFSRQIGDQVVELAIVDARLIDTITGTEFHPVRGLGVDGPLADSSLALLPGFTAFPFDYQRLFPDGRLWQRPEV